MIKTACSIFDTFGRKSLKWKFTRIYRRNLFGGKQSRAGQGSDLSQTRVIVQELPKLLKELNARSMVDAPCGDFFWMEEVELPVGKYVGVDIVEQMIQQNQANYGNQQRSFLVMNIVEDVVPRADLILCRDCLVHLSFDDCKKVIRSFIKSGSRYLLTTTFTGRLKNDDLGEGLWRTLNLQIPPFDFPNPMMIINEKCTELGGQYSDKSLGLWMLKDIQLP